VTGPAGIYYLAMASFPDHPVSAGGAIFPDILVFAADGEVVGPDGPGGALPVSAWEGDADGFDPVTAGAYAIQLQGATFAAVPEPGSLVLLGTGLASLAGYGWRRQRLTR
jgi:hypothetical protein